MSALARYFLKSGMQVAGYDRVASSMTDDLERGGIEIGFVDDPQYIPPDYTDPGLKDGILVIYTPAVPQDSLQLLFFRENGYNIYKRSQVLGHLSGQFKTIAVGGSHGKTTVSAMTAEIFRRSGEGCSAFLGGISKNVNSNLIYNPVSQWAVIEADEFDRSFLTLKPHIAIVTSTDPDHLDIYGDQHSHSLGFMSFLDLLDVGGTAIIKEGLNSIVPHTKNLNVKYYGLESGRDYSAVNINKLGLLYEFDLQTPYGLIRRIKTGVSGWINIENAVGAAAVSLEAGISEQFIREGISGFKGINRRFDIRVNNEAVVYIDDYAHHPGEIRSFILSVRKLFPGKRITGVFQPHLYSRTKDFAAEFGRELSKLDELILLEIYPARENPIAGVSSGIILDAADIAGKCIVQRTKLIDCLRYKKLEVLVTMGAGDIDQLVEPIEKFLLSHAS